MYLVFLEGNSSYYFVIIISFVRAIRTTAISLNTVGSYVWAFGDTLASVVHHCRQFQSQNAAVSNLYT
jgi:hypothetical protein